MRPLDAQDEQHPRHSKPARGRVLPCRVCECKTTPRFLLTRNGWRLTYEMESLRHLGRSPDIVCFSPLPPRIPNSPSPFIMDCSSLARPTIIMAPSSSSPPPCRVSSRCTLWLVRWQLHAETLQSIPQTPTLPSNRRITSFSRFIASTSPCTPRCFRTRRARP